MLFYISLIFNSHFPKHCTLLLSETKVKKAKLANLYWNWVLTGHKSF